MRIYRCILPDWAASPDKPKVFEGQFDDEIIDGLNGLGYNIYYLPNHPSLYDDSITLDGSSVDTFNYVFVDMDLKDGTYPSKEVFIERLKEYSLKPQSIIDSGNGIHAYWKLTDLDAISYLKFQRRLTRFFKTDEAVGKIFQLMRHPGTLNTKLQDNKKECKILESNEIIHTSEDMDNSLPSLNAKDEAYCIQHYNKTYKIQDEVKVNDKIPLKFAQLLKSSQEVKNIWSGNLDDRSKGDYRLGHIMFASGFSKEDALSVLVNSAKALGRGESHRVSYATNIVDKIWTFELAEDKNALTLSNSVEDILKRHQASIKGTRFACWRWIDATLHGFRLGQVIGLVAGSGVGKTAMALNMFEGFVQNNPDYDHFFVCLEQPANEIADRWKTMCGDNTKLHGKVHIISNYNEDNSFRHLSLNEIKDYILKFQQVTGKKVGCVVIDHIGALQKKGKNGENQDLMDICHAMKAFAIQTNTMLVMQSQAPREKAGIGDLELNKDAAYGTVYFESYCDYLVAIWQPLKRCHSEQGCPTVTAFKFCKIRHKKSGFDDIQEDVSYKLYFDSSTEHMLELTQDQEKAFDFFNAKATNKRKADRKTDIVSYTSISWTKEDLNVPTTDINQNSRGIKTA